MSTSHRSVAIVGAGLSGLCLAQSLHRAGLDVRVYERDPAPDIRRQGYRLTIDRYGAAALRACLPPDLFAAVLATASAPADVGYFRLTNQDLGEVFRLTFRSDPERAVNMPIGQVDRATLRAIMLSGLKDRVHFGKAVERAESTANGAILYFDSRAAAAGRPRHRQRFPRHLRSHTPTHSRW